MRKIVAGLFLTLDGVMEAPEQWQFPSFNDEMREAVGEKMATADTMLLARRTYEEFAAFWPNQTSEVPFADEMNNTPKYVVSNTLGTVAWQVTELKQQPGKNINITGSATLVRSLLGHGLLDELDLLVCPVVVGKGRRLFEDGGEQLGLKLVDSKTLSTGVLSLTYAPAGR